MNTVSYGDITLCEHGVNLGPFSDTFLNVEHSEEPTHSGQRRHKYGQQQLIPSLFTC